jgi:protein involved in polysaccharide export with SLBB domain
MTTVSNFLGRWGAVVGLIVGGLSLAGCHSGPQYANVPGMPGSGGPVTEAPPPAAAGTAAGSATAPLTQNPNIDVLHPGDMLVITFADLPTLVSPIEQRVKDDGTITLIENQTFTAANKSRGQLETEIRERYVPKIFVKMTVSVMHQKDTQFYYVGGEVKSPGRQVYISRLTVLGAIKSAGDFTDYANRKKVQLTRASGRTFKINCNDALQNPTLDLEVMPGDNINIPRRNPFSF